MFEGEPSRERSELVPGVFVDTPGHIPNGTRRSRAGDFAPHLYALAQRAGIVQAKQVVILVDGVPWIWRLAEEQFSRAVQIVDQYHAREHVWDVARAVFAAEPTVRDPWVQTVIEKLTEGQLEEVITAIERLPSLPPEPSKTRSLSQ